MPCLFFICLATYDVRSGWNSNSKSKCKIKRWNGGREEEGGRSRIEDGRGQRTKQKAEDKTEIEKAESEMGRGDHRPGDNWTTDHRPSDYRITETAPTGFFLRYLAFLFKWDEGADRAGPGAGPPSAVQLRRTGASALLPPAKPVPQASRLRVRAASRRPLPP